MGNIPLRRPFEVLVRFSLDVQPVRASRLREIFGPVATPIWKFSTNVGSLRRYCFPFSIYYLIDDQQGGAKGMGQSRICSDCIYIAQLVKI